MRSKRRIAAALILTVLCAPGTLLRSDVGWTPPEIITTSEVEFDRDTGTPGWEVDGIWEMRGEGLLFGGYSALIALPDDRLVAFSDRGSRFTFDEPSGGGAYRQVARQRLTEARESDYPDIEGAAYDPASGTYWLSFENDHSIDSFAADHTPGPAREMMEVADGQGWSNNGGAEAFTRLSDGRFIIVPEGERTGLVFGEDPVRGGGFQTFDYVPPVAGHGATDMAQLPDGRVLMLLRNVDVGGGLPPFESKIVIGPAPEPGVPWVPRIALDLEGVIPRDNYEGIALRQQDDGRVAVWLISDDNMSVLQRTLVVRLLLDPAKLKQLP